MHRAWSVVPSVVVLAASSLLAGPPGANEPATPRPAIFSDKSYADAVAASKVGGKITVVKATAAWCGPCKMMDRTTFVDEKVIKWFGDNGLIVEFDVDKQPQLASDLRVSGMPTTIAFKDGKEFDRVLGYRDGASLLTWLEGVKAGRSAGDGFTTKIEKVDENVDKLSMSARQQRAGQLLNSNKLDEATIEYAWLWDNMAKRDPAMVGVRGSFLVMEIQKLLAAHAPAKEKFAAIRERNWSVYAADHANTEAFSDWLILNGVLGEDAKTLTWFDEAKGDPSQSEALKRGAGRVEQVLIKQGRVADLVALYPDPLEPVQQHAQMKADFYDKMPDNEQNNGIREANDRMFRGKAGNLYASLLLSKRDADATRLAAEAIKADDTAAMRMALVQTALDHGSGRQEQVAWLEAAAKLGENTDDLRSKLDKQLAK